MCNAFRLAPSAPGVAASGIGRCHVGFLLPPAGPYRALCEHAGATGAGPAPAVRDDTAACRIRPRRIGITHEGRPTKLEGNPLHPASLGGTDVFMEADVLDLYDPARSRTVRGPMPVESWDSFFTAFSNAVAKAGGDSQFRVRLLTGRVTSPTILRRIKALLERFPKARWHRYEIVNDDNETSGPALGFRKAARRASAPRRRGARLHDRRGSARSRPGPAASVADVCPAARSRAAARMSACTPPKAYGRSPARTPITGSLSIRTSWRIRLAGSGADRRRLLRAGVARGARHRGRSKAASRPRTGPGRQRTAPGNPCACCVDQRSPGRTDLLYRSRRPRRRHA